MQNQDSSRKIEDIYTLLKEETRKRCKIISLDQDMENDLVSLDSDQFQWLYDVSHIDFNIYFRIDDYLVEFITKEEFSHELLNTLWSALFKHTRTLDVCILGEDLPTFIKMMSTLQKKKIEQLIEKNPELDKTVLNSFLNLSGASQLIVKGGIDQNVATKVQLSASTMVSNIMDNHKAIASLSKMILNDPTLYDHSASVSMLSAIIGMSCSEQYGLNKSDLNLLAESALYHDVGKSAIPSQILNKPGKLTDQEFEIMKQHTTLGKQELLKTIEDGAAISPLIVTVVEEHHERMQGQGYPNAKKGCFEQDPANGIHLYSRIIMIADVYSALLMQRVYKAAYNPQDAIKLMVELSETQYDLSIFNKFVGNVTRSFTIMNKDAKSLKSKGNIFTMDDGKLKLHRS